MHHLSAWSMGCKVCSVTAKRRRVEKRHRSQLGTLRSFLWSALTFTRLTVTEDHLATQKQVALVATMSSDGLGIFTKNVVHWIISHGKSNFGTFLDFTYMMNFSKWKLIQFQYMTKPKWRRNWSCNLPIPSLIQFLYPIWAVVAVCLMKISSPLHKTY